MKSAHHDQRRAMVAVSESAGSRPRVRAGGVMSAVPAIPVGVPEPQALRPMQLALLAAAVFVVSAGYGGLDADAAGLAGAADAASGCR